MKILPVLIAPRLIWQFAYQTLQSGKASRPGKPDIVDLRQTVKVNEFVIDPGLLVVILWWDDADDIGRNGDGAEIFQHADSLVAFLHVKPIHKLVRLDGFPDSLV